MIPMRFTIPIYTGVPMGPRDSYGQLPHHPSARYLMVEFGTTLPAVPRRGDFLGDHEVTLITFQPDGPQPSIWCQSEFVGEQRVEQAAEVLAHRAKEIRVELGLEEPED